MIISRTPFRISFFGGGTDYPGVRRRAQLPGRDLLPLRPDLLPVAGRFVRGGPEPRCVLRGTWPGPAGASAASGRGS